MQFALFGVVKGRRHHQRGALWVAVHAAQAVEEIEAAAGGECGRCTHCCADVLPQVFGQVLRGGHGAGAQHGVRG